MKLRNIFEKPIDRHIEGVIKADDESALRTEVEEYVITNEIAKRLEEFLDAYNNYQGVNGAWISGFYGSGKSHLLKMMAFLLENREIDGTPALDYFLPKCKDNAILAASIKKAASIPSKSILFNIDQKADIVSKKAFDALLSVFIKVFNEMRGYYGLLPYIAEFERDLDNRGQFDAFKETYQSISGQPWEKGREEAPLEGENIAEAYAKVSSTDPENAMGILSDYRDDFRLSIEGFAQQVNEYIQSQEPGFRLNFFVDEVGQFIADNTKLMTNLQTIAESLATICNGQSFIIVTAQENLEDVTGRMTEQEGTDYSKIQDRLAVRMKLTSQNVEDVIMSRLLAKNESGKVQLSPIYENEKNHFQTLFSFRSGAKSYRGFRDEEHFVKSYPFIPYQYPLFQSSIQSLSSHQVFEGQHSSVGERSMLSVFQEVVQQNADMEVGTLATFDQMFEGIRKAIKTQHQQLILDAENHLQNEFAIKVLKALFMVKYIQDFKATAENLRVLFISNFNENLEDLQNRLQTALNLLEKEIYIQRTGEDYEYLTDKEKDIEKEIANTQVEMSSVRSELAKIIFDRILTDRKIRYDNPSQDYSFTQKVDEETISHREYELCIHVISPLHEHAGNLNTLKMQGMGKDELRIVLPEDDRLVTDLLLYRRTEKYYQQNYGLTGQEQVRDILIQKNLQNQDRLRSLQNRVSRLITEAYYIVAGNEIDIHSSDPKTCIIQAFHQLISRVYPNRKMLSGNDYTEQHVRQILRERPQELFDEPTSFTNAENEILSFINRNENRGMRTTMQSLVEKFEKKPYGWPYTSILYHTASLIARGKVEVRRDGNMLEGEALIDAILKTSQYLNVILTPQKETSEEDRRKLQEFYEKYFDSFPSTTEAKVMAQEVREKLSRHLERLESLYAQRGQFQFLDDLAHPITILRDCVDKSYSYYLTDFLEKTVQLLRLKEEMIHPIEVFMGGDGKEKYLEINRFLQRESSNLEYLDSDAKLELQSHLQSGEIYKNNTINRAYRLMGQLKARIEERVETEKQKAIEEISEKLETLEQMDQYQALSDEQKQTFIQPFEQTKYQIQQTDWVGTIRDRSRDFQDQQYTSLIEKLVRGGEGKKEVISSSKIRLELKNKIIKNEEDLEEYLEIVRKVYSEELRQGKEILLN